MNDKPDLPSRPAWASRGLASDHPTGLSGDDFRLLFAASGAALIAVDRNLHVQAWNHTAARMFGASASEMIGAQMLSIIPHDRRETAVAAVRLAIEQGNVTEFEFAERDRSGNRRELAVTISPIADDHGTRLGASAFIRDITKRIVLAEELARARKMVSLGQMAGGLAHHFNNILGGLVTSVDFALSSPDPNKHRRALEQTAGGLNRAARLMESLLAFAEGDQRPTDLGDLTEIIIDVVGRMESDWAKRGARVELNLGQLPVVPVRRLPLEHVLLNLIENAIDAMPRGGALTVRTWAHDDRVVIAISDTGRGMSPEEVDHLFEPFYSTKTDPNSDDSTSHGLGLAVVHGIVQYMNGTIAVKSRPGSGTEFRVELPAAGEL